MGDVQAEAEEEGGAAAGLQVRASQAEPGPGHGTFGPCCSL
jgi:hypothetical protein